jgi:hypothetical protein
MEIKLDVSIVSDNLCVQVSEYGLKYDSQFMELMEVAKRSVGGLGVAGFLSGKRIMMLREKISKKIEKHLKNKNKELKNLSVVFNFA